MWQGQAKSVISQILSSKYYAQIKKRISAVFCYIGSMLVAPNLETNCPFFFMRFSVNCRTWPASSDCDISQSNSAAISQYGTVYKRPEVLVYSRKSRSLKIMHCYLGPVVVHPLSTCDCPWFLHLNTPFSLCNILYIDT